ncbi:MAG: hypothetical protein EPN25_08855 [Nitrospirae bacterium]|nr:MAG: hypothetical protein EPN25_08855 [Nitrospirota bacterium]
MTTGSIRKYIGLTMLILLLACGLSLAAANPKGRLSVTQQKYYKSEGAPQLFIIVFDHDKKRGSIPRRIDAWIYLQQAKFVIFDNGYFTEEQPTGATLPDLSQLPHTPLDPGRFHAGMTSKDINRLYGKPDSVETAKLGKHTFRTLRYLTRQSRSGILNVTFYDNRLAGVVAGFALQPDDLDALSRDLQRGAR